MDTLSLSSTGYHKLEVKKAKPKGKAFSSGMGIRAGLIHGKPTTWESPFKSSIDMLILVADSNVYKPKRKPIECQLDHVFS